MAAGNCDDMVWVTWRDNKSRYDGKTHLVPRDVLLDPPTPLTIGTVVTVYWETGRKKYWTAEVAEPRTLRKNVSKAKATPNSNVDEAAAIVTAVPRVRAPV